MRVKICGITKPEQGIAITQLGATALGFICVSKSPRYVSSQQIKAIVSQLPEKVDKIGVFANTEASEIAAIASNTSLTGVQLHGNESADFCLKLREYLPHVEIIKALRIKNSESLTRVDSYTEVVDTLLLDAYHPQLLGGTGATIDWSSLSQFNPRQPWLLAGGLSPANILEALERLNPSGIDLSSGVEKSPGDKDLDKVALLFAKIREGKLLT